MRNSMASVLVLLCFLTGCTSNGGYHGESLESIRSRHTDMVQKYKYGSVAQGYYDESLEAETVADSQDTREDKYLLAIGIDSYKQLPNLEGTSRGARVLALTLKDKYGFKVKVLKDPTLAEILVTIKRYGGMLHKNSHLVIYYAGHGWLDETSGQGYWLPRDAQIDSKENWLSTSDITAALQAMPARNIMVITDSCYLASLQSQPGKAPLAADYTQQVAAQKVRVVLTSGTIAPVEGKTDSEYSAFTEAVLDALQNSRGPINGAELYAAIRSKTTSRQQSAPQYGIIPDSGHQGGDFVFAPLAGRAVETN